MNGSRAPASSIYSVPDEKDRQDVIAYLNTLTLPSWVSSASLRSDQRKLCKLAEVRTQNEFWPLDKFSPVTSVARGLTAILGGNCRA